MNEQDLLARKFESHRAHLAGVAFRMLGSRAEADDAVQEAWLRLNGTGKTELENLRGWLTTVVARVCLDMLRSRKARREASDTTADAQAQTPLAVESGAEQQALVDSVGLALLVVLDALPPAERVAFVLHDLFDLTFEEIAPILERTPTATRKLASRARRRVQGQPATLDTDRTRRRELVEAFITASRSSDLSALLRVLDADVVFRTDPAASKLAGAWGETHGAEDVAKLFLGRAQAARVVLVDGEIGVEIAPHGKLLLVAAITIENDRITEIEAVAGKASLGEMELTEL